MLSKMHAVALQPFKGEQLSSKLRFRTPVVVSFWLRTACDSLSVPSVLVKMVVNFADDYWFWDRTDFSSLEVASYLTDSGALVNATIRHRAEGIVLLEVRPEYNYLVTNPLEVRTPNPRLGPQICVNGGDLRSQTPAVVSFWLRTECHSLAVPSEVLNAVIDFADDYFNRTDFTDIVYVSYQTDSGGVVDGEIALYFPCKLLLYILPRFERFVKRRHMWVTLPNSRLAPPISFEPY